MRRIQIILGVLVMVIGMFASPALAAAGDQYFSRINCSQYYGVYIYSSAENWVDYTWDSGTTSKWNPYANYWGYNTNDGSTWAVIAWDHANSAAMGRYCKKFL